MFICIFRNNLLQYLMYTLRWKTAQKHIVLWVESIPFPDSSMVLVTEKVVDGAMSHHKCLPWLQIRTAQTTPVSTTHFLLLW